MVSALVVAQGRGKSKTASVVFSNNVFTTVGQGLGGTRATAGVEAATAPTEATAAGAVEGTRETGNMAVAGLDTVSAAETGTTTGIETAVAIGRWRRISIDSKWPIDEWKKLPPSHFERSTAAYKWDQTRQKNWIARQRR